jgi:hypothetical protein
VWRPFVRRGLRIAGYVTVANALIGLLGLILGWSLIDTVGLLNLLEGVALMLMAALMDLSGSFSFRMFQQKILGEKKPIDQQTIASYREGAQSTLIGGGVLMIIALILAVPFI